MLLLPTQLFVTIEPPLPLKYKRLLSNKDENQVEDPPSDSNEAAFKEGIYPAARSVIWLHKSGVFADILTVTIMV